MRVSSTSLIQLLVVLASITVCSHGIAQQTNDTSPINSNDAAQDNIQRIVKMLENKTNQLSAEQQCLSTERDHLCAQLYELLIEQQRGKLKDNVDQRLFDQFSQAYLTLVSDNNSLQSRITELEKDSSELRNLDDQKSAEIVELQSIIDTQSKSIEKFKQQLSDNKAASQLQNEQLHSMQSLLDHTLSEQETQNRTRDRLKSQLLISASLATQQSEQVATLQKQLSTTELANERTAEKLNETIAKYDRDTLALGDQVRDKTAQLANLQQQLAAQSKSRKRYKRQLIETAELAQRQSMQLVSIQRDSEKARSSNTALLQKLEAANKTNEQLVQESISLTEKHTRLAEQNAVNANALKAELTGRDEQIRKLKAEAGEQSGNLTRLTEKYNELLVEQDKHLQQLENSRQVAAQRTSKMAELDQTIATLTQEINKKTSQSGQLQQQLQDTLASAAQSNAKQQQQITDLTTEVSSLNDQINEISARQSLANEGLAKSQQKNRELVAELQQLTTNISGLNNKSSSMTQELESARLNLSNSQDENLELIKSMTQLEDELNEINNKITGLESSLEASQAARIAADKKAGALTEEVNSLQILLTELQSANGLAAQKLTDLRNELDISNTRLSEKQNKLDALEAEKAALEKNSGDFIRDTEALSDIIRTELSDSSNPAFEVSVETDQTITVQAGSNKLFRIGSSKLSADGKQILSKMADTLEQSTDRHIIIEGHSDNTPLGSKLEAVFNDNWGLSIARALSTAKFIAARSNNIANRIAVRGLGSSQPISDNSTPEGRQKNRRVEILLLPPNNPVAVTDQ
ncbi:hypothetical protein AB833_04805 [Chromatiales bacterium (ex Bugula neritina AB1)]|nr:hypothetical protein AB833_04805 [Chromatiales bacterium (ex Bugula neritina AB1)]